MIPTELHKMLECPLCYRSLKQKKMFLCCERCEVAYPLVDEDVVLLDRERSWPEADAKNRGYIHTYNLDNAPQRPKPLSKRPKESC